MKKHRKKKPVIGKTSKRLQVYLDRVLGKWLTFIIDGSKLEILQEAAKAKNMTFDTYLQYVIREALKDNKLEVRI